MKEDEVGNGHGSSPHWASSRRAARHLHARAATATAAALGWAAERPQLPHASAAQPQLSRLGCPCSPTQQQRPLNFHASAAQPAKTTPAAAPPIGQQPKSHTPPPAQHGSNSSSRAAAAPPIGRAAETPPLLHAWQG
ncbi:uncharacterized protein LOC131023520 [Salvia miltiorrhiza]|uniref:uncharacterized protein LOC131023520 n=1 Tax=Salvia miltiorrhiza TaxID=226208 RepID=UPI0025AD29C4|nr:uncharacterized protein LOC131023520 [Salvia miltiorrhiza]